MKWFYLYPYRQYLYPKVKNKPEVFVKVKYNQGPQFAHAELFSCCLQTASCLQVFPVRLLAKKINFKKLFKKF